jgi:prevent-host-death family protein
MCFGDILIVENEVITISKFKATCLTLLDSVKDTGRSILVTRRGEPVALITPPPKPKKPESWLGMFQSEGKIVGDIISPNFNNDTGRLIF